MSLVILLEEEHLLAVDKPAGLLVVPSAWTPLAETLLGQAKAHVGPDRRVWAIHRLDRETSGVVLFAKSPEACRSIHHQFEARTIEKVYEAIVKGHPSQEQGVITLSIGRGRKWTEARAGSSRAKQWARTEYRVLERSGPVSRLELHPKTGRFHQIRAHLAAIGHPLAHDPIYHKDSPWDWVNRAPLHCSRISFDHPVTGRRLSVESPFPEDLRRILRRFRGRFCWGHFSGRELSL